MPASISVMNIDNSIKSILCYNKAEITETGLILLKHYDNFKKANAIINLGDISLLGKYLEPKTNTQHSQLFPSKDTTISYHRDGNHKLESSSYIDFEDFTSKLVRRNYNYIYIVEKKNWYLLTIDNNLIELFEIFKTEVQSLQLSQQKSFMPFINKKNDIIIKRNHSTLISNLDHIKLKSTNKHKI